MSACDGWRAPSRPPSPAGVLAAFLVASGLAGCIEDPTPSLPSGASAGRALEDGVVEAIVLNDTVADYVGGKEVLVDYGRWTLHLPSHVEGLPGEEVEFRFRLAPVGRIQEPVPVTVGLGTRLVGPNATAVVPPEGATLSARVLVGPVPNAVLVVNVTGVEAPPVRVASWASLVPVVPRGERDDADIPRGLYVAVAANRTATVVRGLGPLVGVDCQLNVRLVGNATVQARDGVPTLVAFLLRSASDLCEMDAPAHNPRVTITTGPLPPGPFRVLLYEQRVGAHLPPSEWELTAREVTIE